MSQQNPFEPTDAATDERFLSFEFLAYDLEKIATEGGEGNAAQMRDAVNKLREWRERFNVRFSELEEATGDFGALDALMREEQEEEEDKRR